MIFLFTMCIAGERSHGDTDRLCRCLEPLESRPHDWRRLSPLCEVQISFKHTASATVAGTSVYDFIE
jgi:hypothetical protein